MLQATNLYKSYTLGNQLSHNTVAALRGVSLELTSGQWLAIQGSSGSGKSTLLHLLGLLDIPDSGEIFLEGQALHNLDDEARTRLRREALGFVFQSFELLPTLSAAENILLPAEVMGTMATARERLKNLATRLGITQRLHHRPSELSGGQRQRVALARALINQPKLILADEPTGNLDSQTGDAVLQLLRQGVDELGWTVLMVTHDKDAAAYADTCIWLEDGHILNQNNNIPIAE